MIFEIKLKYQNGSSRGGGRGRGGREEIKICGTFFRPEHEKEPET